jgi:hypothetical protein
MSALRVVAESRGGLWYFAHPYTRLDALSGDGHRLGRGRADLDGDRGLVGRHVGRPYQKVVAPIKALALGPASAMIAPS